MNCLRSDNGREYCSNEFVEYCSKHGIRHEKTVSHIVQHKGVGVSINRTLNERARSMLSLANLSENFLAEALNMACYLVNKSSSHALECDVSQHVWSGKEW